MAGNSVFTTTSCVADARIYLEGHEYIAGVPYERVTGSTFKEKRDFICNLGVHDLNALLLDAKGFCLKADAGDEKILLLPTGFLMLFGSCGSQCVRWGVSSDSDDTNRVKYMLSEALNSFPEFRNGKFGAGPFFTFLQGSDVD